MRRIVTLHRENDALENKLIFFLHPRGYGIQSCDLHMQLLLGFFYPWFQRRLRLDALKQFMTDAFSLWLCPPAIKWHSYYYSTQPSYHSSVKIRTVTPMSVTAVTAIEGCSRSS